MVYNLAFQLWAAKCIRAKLSAYRTPVFDCAAVSSCTCVEETSHLHLQRHKAILHGTCTVKDKGDRSLRKVCSHLPTDADDIPAKRRHLCSVQFTVSGIFKLVCSWNWLFPCRGNYVDRCLTIYIFTFVTAVGIDLGTHNMPTTDHRSIYMATYPLRMGAQPGCSWNIVQTMSSCKLKLMFCWPAS
jgi:hypothetical protein